VGWNRDVKSMHCVLEQTGFVHFINVALVDSVGLSDKSNEDSVGGIDIGPVVPNSTRIDVESCEYFCRGLVQIKNHLDMSVWVVADNSDCVGGPDAGDFARGGVFDALIYLTDLFRGLVLVT
jgi:hypothetical protein